MKISSFMKNYMLYVRGIKNNFFLNIIFTPLAWISIMIISFMDFLRKHGLSKTIESPLPLISVGNLTYGGTNKTPFVEMLSHYAEKKHVRTGIVTRGYSGHADKVILLHNGNEKRELTGDEPLLLSKKLPNIPVAVAKKRLDGIKALKNEGIELVIADDAFQHKILNRDVDIVLIDCLCPFGSGKLIPAGIMREKINALSRADIVVLTKSDQVNQDELESLKKIVNKYVSLNQIFTSRLEINDWLLFGTNETPKENAKIFAFSAIGSPESFIRSINSYGFITAGFKNFTDHHQFTLKDLEEISREADESKAEYIMCTEKDLYNLPEKTKWPFNLPLIIPKIKTIVNENDKFFELLTELLQPQIIIASNGYGEDAIGTILAKKFRERLRHSKISAFPLVGRGDSYLQSGFDTKSAPSITPSGGVLKYSLKDLWGDMRAGLLLHVKKQLSDWKKIAHRIRTPICVGDVYLLLHCLFGSGARPMFCATAKTVYLSGHWRIERTIINAFTLRTWTRDKKSAEQLGKKAVYSGSPIMDLLNEGVIEDQEKNVILLLPGSRTRACKDVKMLLDAAEIMHSHGENNFRMVLAPTLQVDEFLSACKDFGWTVDDEKLIHNEITIELTHESIASASNGVKILIGLGGTANQLCAGLGIPVISIDEKGKRVQKKLLGDCEILTSPEGKSLAECALRVLNDKKLYEFMSDAGKQRMGKPGAVDDIVDYACKNLGWDIRDKVYERFRV